MHLCDVLKRSDMLEQISWNDYFFYIGIVSVIYWLFVVTIYYRYDVLQLMQGRQRLGDQAAKHRPGIPDSSIHLVHELMEELKPVFASKEDLLGKKDLLAQVQMRLHNFPMLRGSELEEAVIHHIILESNEQCGMAVHAEEIKQIWTEGN